MHKNLHSPTKLTEFARDWEEEEDDTLIGKLVTKLTNVYNTGYNSVNVAPNTSQAAATSSQKQPPNESQLIEPQTPIPTSDAARDKPNASMSSSLSSSSHSNMIASTSSSSAPPDTTLPSIEHVNDHDTRTPSSIMTRISSLVALKSSNQLTNYKDTDLQKFWMPDAKSKECYECGQKFTTFRRKHHCRLCGQIFCSKCCSQVVPGRIIKCTGNLKVCTYCSKVVLAYLKSSSSALDMQSDINSDLLALHDDLSSKLASCDEVTDTASTAEYSASPVRRKISVGYQEERLTSYSQSASLAISNEERRSILQQSQSLRILFEELVAELPLQNRGSDLTRFLMLRQKSSNSQQAVAILLAMIEAGFVVALLPESVTGDLHFNEDSLYRLAQASDLMTSSTSSFQLDLNTDSSSAFVSRNLADESQRGGGGGGGGTSAEKEHHEETANRNLLPLKNFDMQNTLLFTVGSKPLLEAFCWHEEQLLNQLLHAEGLDRKWSHVLIPICARLANLVTPTFDGMDIRGVANFKKVPGGDRMESVIVGGVVISKNVAHKDMAVFVQKPRILLLQCAVSYQRREGKFASLDILMLQEEEHLKNVTERIACLQPDVVLVHKNVARIAQDMLRQRGITLVLDVKLAVLERLARTLDCDVVTNIDSNIGRPRLGTCDAFRIRRFAGDFGSEAKTLMCFEVAAMPRNHCVLLRGGSEGELAKVKRVASFLAYVRYNWRFELSFLLDVFAVPPPPKEDAFEESSAAESESQKEAVSPVGVKVGTSSSRQLRSERRSDDTRSLNIENVKDFSDPLRNTEAVAMPGSVFDEADAVPVTLAVETPYDNKFKAALTTSILSISPFMAFPLPFLETESGRKCEIRRRFPKDLFYSKHWAGEGGGRMQVERVKSVGSGSGSSREMEERVKLGEPHAFTTYLITNPTTDNKELQSLWARYRACGGQLPKKRSMVKSTDKSHAVEEKNRAAAAAAAPESDTPPPVDALDIENHQKLSLLFCSYYNSPKEASNVVSQKLAFCAQPLHLDMHYYGANDIMLGSFLERYCFRTSYICKWCNLPMIDHVKRYVHSMGCVQVYLTEEPKRLPANTIFVATQCDLCQEGSPPVPLSMDSKCWSLAKYLEQRFHCHAYRRRQINVDAPLPDATRSVSGSGGCTHSLNRELVHSFSLNGIVANFQYSAIQTWEIRLPGLVCGLVGTDRLLCDNTKALQEEVKLLSQSGYEVFAKILDRLAQFSTETENAVIAGLKAALTSDQLMFKSRVEVVHTVLTDEKGTRVNEVEDAMLLAKRALAESVEAWGPRLHEAAQQYKLMLKSEAAAAEQQPGEEEEREKEERSEKGGKSDSDEGVLLDMSGASVGEKSSARITSTGSNSSGASSRKGPEQKKKVKSIWNQFVSSSGTTTLLQSPIPANEHHTLPLGMFPVTVNDQDLSSIVAHTLISFEYRKALELMGSGDAMAASSPHAKRKSQEGSVGEAEDEKDGRGGGEEKKNKSHCHAEVHYHDSTMNVTCKIYFAREFEAMRRICLRATVGGEAGEEDEEAVALKRRTATGGGGSGNNLSPKLQLLLERVDSKGRLSLESWRAPDAEEIRKEFARSLSRSVLWDAKGGKSGSRFSKTLDKRFILKEMSRTDVAIFENFAPNYFEYINESAKADQPTLLAKIFGVFKVTIKKKDSSEEKNVLVMENLFFDRNICNKFDLKGSERNRLADPINQEGDCVLLDQNLLQMAWSNPLYIQSHSSKVLKDTIARDASFLEKNEVMDYSLLVGLDTERKVLVLGIIDYIRTFTLDKKLESLVKQTGLLGGQGKLPTIISPKMYKNRFSVAMERYFMVVPDRWEGLAK